MSITHQPRFRLLSAFAVATLLAVVLVGCSSEPSTDTAYAGLLGTIPDTPELRREVYINDYALVRQMFDIPLPGLGDDEDAVEEFYKWLPPPGFEGEADDPPVWGFGDISFFDPFSPYRNFTAENLQHLAFDVRSMDQSIVALALPVTLEVVRGRFDPQATDKALESCSECEPHSREEYGGVSYYSWGGDYAVNLQLRFAPPAFDRLGRGGRIAVLDEYVFRTLGTSDMEALIDASLNEGASLADVEEFRLLAGGMSRLGAYAMLLSDDVEDYDIDHVPADSILTLKQVQELRRELLGRGPWLRPYEAFATGAGKDEKGHYMALVLVHADDASAEENVGLLRRIIEEKRSIVTGDLWSDDIERLEIHTEGRALLAKLRGRFASKWLQWVQVRDILIPYENDRSDIEPAPTAVTRDGSGGSGSVAAYAAWCGQFGEIEEGDEPETWGELQRYFKSVLGAWEERTPPAGLKDFHNVEHAVTKALYDLFRSQDANAPLDPDVLIWWTRTAEAMALELDLDAAVNALDDETRAQLQDAGCIDGPPPPEPTPKVPPEPAATAPSWPTVTPAPYVEPTPPPTVTPEPYVELTPPPTAMPIVAAPPTVTPRPTEPTEPEQPPTATPAVAVAAATPTPLPTAAPTPKSPANVRYALDGSTIHVSWDAVDGADSYRVYHHDFFDSSCMVWDGIPAFCEELATNVLETSYVHASPDRDENYYWVVACNSGGCSEIDSENPARQVGAESTESTGTSAAPSADRAALIALYNVMDGANWRQDRNWLSEQPIRRWHGVTTAATVESLPCSSPSTP